MRVYDGLGKTFTMHGEKVWDLEVWCPRCLASPGNSCPRLFSVESHPERIYRAGYMQGVNAQREVSVVRADETQGDTDDRGHMSTR